MGKKKRNCYGNADKVILAGKIRKASWRRQLWWALKDWLEFQKGEIW